MPRMPFSGVRISWLMFATNCDLAMLAAAASSRARTRSPIVSRSIRSLRSISPKTRWTRAASSSAEISSATMPSANKGAIWASIASPGRLLVQARAAIGVPSGARIWTLAGMARFQASSRTSETRMAWATSCSRAASMRRADSSSR